ncbi:MAG: Gfo/Idh/MocA family oxidoreductase [Christensenellaceae bacterium]|jgi:predicted dehydrogenase|nr:Gfo/Idh/MocA family oxidoreductase [Christensenellaceae bacterium]
MKDYLRYGIIGIGKMGHNHAIRINYGLDKNARLLAVCDIDKARRDWAEKNLPKVKCYSDYKELLSSKDIDAVIIATPHYSHPVIAKEALLAGKHVLCEKPAGVYTKAVRELYDTAKDCSNRVFGIMYNQRSNPLYSKAKKIIESGEMGEIKRISWIITNWYRPQAYYDQGGWRGTWEGEGGGVLINQCPHQLDLFQWLAGMPIKVMGYVKTSVKRNINVENDVTFYTEYENGASGVFVTSTHDFPGTNRLEIDGDGGQIVIEQHALSEKMTYYKLKIKETEFNKNNKKFMPRIPYKKKTYKTSTLQNAFALGIIGQHMNIIRNFSKAVMKGEKLIAPGTDGINGLTLSNAVYLSSWLNKEIDLPFDEALFIEQLNKKIAEEKAKQ